MADKSAFPSEFANEDELRKEVERRIRHTSLVLDIGCGIRPQDFFVPRTHLCVDPHLPYLLRLHKESPPDCGRVVLNFPWRQIMNALPDASVETVFALDFIEHLDRNEGSDFLAEACRVSSVQVVLFTPLGYYEQELPDDGVTDKWGMDGGIWQVHRSGWTPTDFDGWQVLVCRDFHPPETGRDGKPLPTGAFWAIKDIPPLPGKAIPLTAKATSHFNALLLKVGRGAGRRVRRILRIAQR